MQSKGCVVAATVVLALGGCATPPPPPPPLLVAYPGPTKTTADFQADDTACRGLAAQPPGPPQPALTGRSSAAAAESRVPQSSPPNPNDAQQAGTPPQSPSTPGSIYLQCMAARYNIVQPIEPDVPVAYAYYNPYPVYLGYGDYYPFLYGSYFGVGYFGRYGGYRGFHGYRGGYGFHNGFGYRGGYGFGGGGYHGGGFHGGGFHGYGRH